MSVEQQPSYHDENPPNISLNIIVPIDQLDYDDLLSLSEIVTDIQNLSFYVIFNQHIPYKASTWSEHCSGG